jgi:hypothetical protein
MIVYVLIALAAAALACRVSAARRSGAERPVICGRHG